MRSLIENEINYLKVNIERGECMKIKNCVDFRDNNEETHYISKFIE